MDINNILQEIFKSITFGSSESTELSGLAGTGWTTGDLGSYSFKVADSLYQQSCTFGYDTTEASATSSLYFDAATGGITKLVWSSSDMWHKNSFFPEAVSTSGKAIGCTDQQEG